ncbi:MAG: hypothetical protein ACXAEU_15515 [Candidatus Hodarchaeales archaeon]
MTQNLKSWRNNGKDSRKARTSAGRILVVGSQACGKTALATKLAAKTGEKVQYREEFGGTIETEYLRVSYDSGSFFSLLLPIGGQEKWKKLRASFGEAAEAIIAVIDSTTTIFWPTSLEQAVDISPLIPYEGYPIGFVVTKEDQNVLIRNKTKEFAEVIVKGIKEAKDNGFSWWSRGYKIIERHARIDGDTMPFSKAEQVIVNALEREYFTNVVPGSASRATQLLEGFSLVNCRMFSRALASIVSQGQSENQSAVLSLLNEMRPTLLELDNSWENLLKKYPDAGSEPHVPVNISEAEIEEAITKKLLAGEEDIKNIGKRAKELSKETSWILEDVIHASTFTEDGLEKIAELTHRVMKKIDEGKPADKFTMLDPLEDVL